MGGWFAVTVEVENFDSKMFVVFEEEEANYGQDDGDDKEYCFEAAKLYESAVFDFALSL